MQVDLDLTATFYPFLDRGLQEQMVQLGKCSENGSVQNVRESTCETLVSHVFYLSREVLENEPKSLQVSSKAII